MVAERCQALAEQATANALKDHWQGRADLMYEQNGDGAVDDHFNFQAHSGPESGGVYTARRCLPEASKMEEEDSTSS